MNQLQQQPFVFLLANREAGEAEQLSDEQNRLRLPRPRAKTGDPHRQRSASVDQAVVHTLAVPIECFAGALGQAVKLALQIAIQPGPAKQDIRFQQLGLIGNPLGGLPAGNGAGKIDLRRPVDRMHVAPGVEGFAPSGRFDVRHAVLIALGAEFVSGTLGANRFHLPSVSHDARSRKLQRDDVH